MPLYCIDKNKVFQRPGRLNNNQSYLLDDVMIEANWIDYLADELKRYDDSVNWGRQINYHLNSSIVQSQIDAFKVIYARLKGRLDDKLLPITSSESQGIVHYLSDGIQRCTHGMLERAQMFVASMQLPESIDEYLCLARTQLVEDMANSGIKSQNVHDQAAVFLWADEIGYALNTDVDDVLNINISLLKPTIMDKIDELMECHYQYHSWPELIIKQFKSKKLVYTGYNGYNELGYTSGEYDKFLVAISQLLGQQAQYDFLLMNDDCTKICDINWDLVRQKLWRKLVDEGYVVNPEPDYTKLTRNSETRTQAMHYLLALAKNDPNELDGYCDKLYDFGYLQIIIKQAMAHLQYNEIGVFNKVLCDLLNNEVSSRVIMHSSELRTITNWNHLNHLGQAPLHKAAQSGLVKAVKNLIELGANINVQDSNKETPLYKAAANGHSQVIDQLLSQRGIQPNTTTKNFKATPLHIACYNGYGDIVDKLCRFDPQLLWVRVSNKSSLCVHLAAQKGHLDVIKKLVAYDDRLWYTTLDSGLNMAHLAAASGHYDVIQYIFDSCPQLLKATESYQGTVLMFAIIEPKFIPVSDSLYQYKQRIISLLVDQAGLDINAHNEADGNTVMHDAIIYQSYKLARYLVNQYYDTIQINKRNKQNESLLSLAIKNDYLDIAEKIVAKGTELDDISSLVRLLTKENDQGETPLNLAFKKGVISVFKALHDKGGIEDCAQNLYKLAIEDCDEKRHNPQQGDQPLIAWLLDHQCVDMVDILLNNFEQHNLIGLLDQKLADWAHYDKVYQQVLAQGSYRSCQIMLKAICHGQLSRTFDGYCLYMNAVYNADHAAALVDLVSQYYPSYINQRDCQGETALHHAVKIKNVAAVDALLVHKVDTTINNYEGQTALDIAQANNDSVLVDKIQTKQTRPVPMANIAWQMSHIEKRQLANTNSQAGLYDQYIDYDEIANHNQHSQPAGYYLVQLGVHQPDQLANYLPKLKERGVLDKILSHALDIAMSDHPEWLEIFVNHLQQAQSEQLTASLSREQVHQLLQRHIVPSKCHISLQTVISLIDPIKRDQFVSELINTSDFSLLDAAVHHNNVDLVKQILLYNGVTINLHHQIYNIKESGYEPKDMVPIMESLCCYVSNQNLWHDKQHDGYESILNLALSLGDAYFDIGLVISRYCDFIDINSTLLTSDTWSRFMSYAAQCGESHLFQLIAHSDQIIQAIEWQRQPAMILSAAACNQDSASQIIESLITISKQRSGSMFAISLLRIILSRNEIPLHTIACNVSQGYYILDKLIEKGVPLDLTWKDKKGYTPLERAAYTGNAGFIDRLIKWYGHRDAPRGLDEQLHKALLISCRQGHINIFNQITSNPRLNHLIHWREPKSGRTALYWATMNFNQYCPGGSFAVIPLQSLNGKKQVIETLINHYDMQLSQKDSIGQTPLFNVAIEAGEAYVILKDVISNEQLTNELDRLINLHNPNSNHPLFLASKLTDLGEKGVKRWLEQYPDAVSARTSSNVTPLYVAAQYNNQAAVDYLLQQGMDCNVLNTISNRLNKGNQVLHWLVEHHDTSNFKNVLQRLSSDQCLERLADKNNDNLTPLQMAVKKDYIEIIDAVVNSNGFANHCNELCAQLKDVTTSDGTPLLISLLDHEYYQVVQHMLEHVSTDQLCSMLLQQHAKSGQYALSDFIKHEQNGNLGAFSIDFIEKLDHEFVQQSNQTETIGHILVSDQHDDVVSKVKALIDQYEKHDRLGCQLLRQLNAQGELPLHTAAANLEQGRDLVAMLAQKYPSDMYQVNDKGQTPMHVAAEKGNWRVVQVLKSLSQTSLDLQDQNGRTPKQTAIDQGHFAVADLLNHTEYNHRLTSGNGPRPFIFGEAADNARIHNQTYQPGQG